MDSPLWVYLANADSVSYKLTFSFDGELSASLVGKPKRVYRRGPLAVLKAGLKFAVAGFRSTKF